MILNATAEKLKRQSKDDFEGRHFEAWRIVHTVAWYLHYPLSYRVRSAGVEAVDAHHDQYDEPLRHGGYADAITRWLHH